MLPHLVFGDGSSCSPRTSGSRAPPVHAIALRRVVDIGRRGPAAGTARVRRQLRDCWPRLYRWHGWLGWCTAGSPEWTTRRVPAGVPICAVCPGALRLRSGGAHVELPGGRRAVPPLRNVDVVVVPGVVRVAGGLWLGGVTVP
ncbi:hypothetical protein [Actinophytocola sp.]|uniref:hypothetical protein n=1 Tax=Actinophytocola sp. TaxID=1872138 RepID=UPI0039C85A2D